MSQLDELLQDIEDGGSAGMGASEEHIVIGMDRYITVPDSLKKIAVQYDHNIETVTFDCPNFWDEHELSKMVVSVNYMRSDGKAKSCPINPKTVRVSETNPKIMHFDWTLSREVTEAPGNISFLVCIKLMGDVTDKDGNIVRGEVIHWNSELNTDMYVSEGLEADSETKQIYNDVAYVLLSRMEELEAIGLSHVVDIKEETDGYLVTFKDVSGQDEDGNPMVVERAIKILHGAIFTPSISSNGYLTWSNNQGLENPSPVNVTGPKGPRGNQGAVYYSHELDSGVARLNPKREYKITRNMVNPELKTPARSFLNEDIGYTATYVGGYRDDGASIGSKVYFSNCETFRVFDSETETVTHMQIPWNPSDSDGVPPIAVGTKIYLFARDTGSAAISGERYGAYIYDTETDTFEGVLPANYAGYYGEGGFFDYCGVVDKKIYMYLRYTSSATMYIFDTATNELSLLPNISTTPRKHSVAAVYGKYIYLLGSEPDSTTDESALLIDVFDTESGTMSTLSLTLPVYPVYIRAVTVDSKVYLFGGSKPGSHPDGVGFATPKDGLSNDITVFDMENETITSLTSEQYFDVFGGTATAVGNRIYLTNGVYSSTPGVRLHNVYIFDTVTNTLTLDSMLSADPDHLSGSNDQNSIPIYSVVIDDKLLYFTEGLDEGVTKLYGGIFAIRCDGYTCNFALSSNGVEYELLPDLYDEYRDRLYFEILGLSLDDAGTTLSVAYYLDRANEVKDIIVSNFDIDRCELIVSNAAKVLEVSETTTSKDEKGDSFDGTAEKLVSTSDPFLIQRLNEEGTSVGTIVMVNDGKHTVGVQGQKVTIQAWDNENDKNTKAGISVSGVDGNVIVLSNGKEIAFPTDKSGIVALTDDLGNVSISFDELTDEQKAQLKGEKGADGMNGKGGKYELLEENFQKGTLYNQSGVLRYEASAIECWCTKEGYYIPLKKGDVVKGIGTVQYRALSRSNWENPSNSPKAFPFRQGEYEIPEDDDYVFSLRLDDNSAEYDAGLSELLPQFMILERGACPTKAKLNNEAKSVFCVMTYNVGGWYYGIGAKIPEGYANEYISCHQETLAKYKPDILACQEYMDPISEYKLAGYYFFDEYYCNVVQANETTSYTGKALCTSRTLEDVSTTAFSVGSGLNPCYQKGYVILNGRRVCVINAHLDLTARIGEDGMTAEFDEILTAVEDEEYFIIMGDLNIDLQDKTTSLYLNTYQKALDKGYKLCNGGAFGDFITHKGENLAIDNVIVSANINIKSVIVDKTKENYSTVRGNGTDHYPLVAYLEVF